MENKSKNYVKLSYHSSFKYIKHFLFPAFYNGFSSKSSFWMDIDKKKVIKNNTEYISAWRKASYTSYFNNSVNTINLSLTSQTEYRSNDKSFHFYINPHTQRHGYAPGKIPHLNVTAMKNIIVCNLNGLIADRWKNHITKGQKNYMWCRFYVILYKFVTKLWNRRWRIIWREMKEKLIIQNVFIQDYITYILMCFYNLLTRIW